MLGSQSPEGHQQWGLSGKAGHFSCAAEDPISVASLT